MGPQVWITVPDAAEQLGSDVLAVRQLLRDGTLLGVRGEDGVMRIPAEMVGGGVPLKGLAGTLTLLRDSGYDDAQAMTWLYTPDDSLPGTPVEALVANRGTEVKRRAQASAW